MYEQYIIGSENVPIWCEKELTPYLKSDGTIGYEYQGLTKIFYLALGDMLIYRNGMVIVVRSNFTTTS